jgi:hypothetical protein
MSVSRKKTDYQRMLKEFDKLLVNAPAGRHLRAWCDRMTARRIHWLTITLAQVVVRSVDGLYVLGEIVRHGMTGWNVPTPPIEEWERMYRRPRSTMQRVFDHLVTVPPEWCDAFGVPADCGPVGGGTALRMSQLFFRELQKQDSEELDRQLREYLQTPEAVDRVRQGHVLARASYEEALSTPLAGEEVDDTALGQKEIQFILLVWLPCWLEYGESASQLLMRAETGDIVTVEKLLRLDKRTMFFRRIREIVDGAIHSRMDGAFALHVNAFGGMPQTLWKRDGLRIGLSKFILTQSQRLSAINSQLMGKPLTRRDIFEAFHAFARDQGFRRDQTLPVDEEAFNKRISREKRFRTAEGWDIFGA